MGSSVWWSWKGQPGQIYVNHYFDVLFLFSSVGISYLMLLKQCLVLRRKQTGL